MRKILDISVLLLALALMSIAIVQPRALWTDYPGKPHAPGAVR